MKVFIALFVAFSALISVKCDTTTDPKEWLNKTNAEYNNMSETDIKTHIDSNVRTLVVMMKEAADQYVKEDLDLVAKVYGNIVKFVESGMTTVHSVLDKEEPKARKHIYAELGVTVEAFKVRSVAEKQKRVRNALKVTNTDVNLTKKFNAMYDMALKFDKQDAEDNRKKGRQFWADFDNKIYEFLSANRKDLEMDIKKLKTSAIRAKNLQVMINDMTLLMEIGVSLLE